MLSVNAQVFRAFLGNRRGVSAVEFAIVAPLFLIILFGIVVYGLYFGTALSVAQVAAESARASIAGLDDTERAQLATDRISEMVAENPLLDADRMDVSAAADPDNSEIFVVTIQYDASNLPFLGLAGLIPPPPEPIVRTSTIQRGGFQ